MSGQGGKRSLRGRRGSRNAAKKRVQRDNDRNIAACKAARQRRLFGAYRRKNAVRRLEHGQKGRNKLGGGKTQTAAGALGVRRIRGAAGGKIKYKTSRRKSDLRGGRKGHSKKRKSRARISQRQRKSLFLSGGTGHESHRRQLRPRRCPPGY